MTVLSFRNFALGTLIMLSYLAVAKTEPTPAPIKLESNDSGEIWLQAQINDLSGKMLVDTGSSGSVLKQSKLSKIGDESQLLSTHDGFGLGDKTTKIISSLVSIEKFKIAGQELNLKQINTHPLPHLNDSYIGIIGLDALRDIATAIEFSPESITLLTTNKKKQAPTKGAELFESKLGLLYFTSKLKEKNIGLIVDSGSQYTVIDEKRIPALAINASILEGASTLDIEGNEIPIMVTEPLSLKIDDQVLFTSKMLATNLSSVIENDQFEFEVVGVIGLNNLRQSNAIMDLKSSSISFQ